MPPPDNHVHSEWSWDTQTGSMERSCERALALGLPAIAFTEHADFTVWAEDDPGRHEDGPGRPDPDGLDAPSRDGRASADGSAGNSLGLPGRTRIRPLDVTGYQASIELCRDRFRELRIVSGIETGEPHLFAGSTAAVLASGSFDRVLGSLHALAHEGRLVNASSLYGTYPPGELIRRYLTEVVTLIEGSDAFGILAHLDYPRRHWPAAAGPYREADFEEEYRAVLRALAGSGRVLEINTYSPLLSAEVLRWWRQEGGTAVSFGSDAHVSWRVGDKFSLAVAVAEDAGFTRGADPLGFWRR